MIKCAKQGSPRELGSVAGCRGNCVPVTRMRRRWPISPRSTLCRIADIQPRNCRSVPKSDFGFVSTPIALALIGCASSVALPQTIPRHRAVEETKTASRSSRQHGCFGNGPLNSRGSHAADPDGSRHGSLRWKLSIRRLEFLQADDVRVRLAKPDEKVRQAASDVC
jgi:hypothetical protein